MATDYPQPMTVRGILKTTDESGSRSLLDAALTRFGQVMCGWRGHDSVLQFDQSRVFLQCMSCGHQSPGWEIERTPAASPLRLERLAGARML